MLENIDQLIRMAQVLKVRAMNLSTDLARLPKASKEDAQAASDASYKAQEVQTALERIRANLS